MKVLSKQLVLLLIATFLFMMSSMMANPIIVGYCGSLGGTGWVMGIVSGILNICSFFCRPFVGKAADRFSRKKLAVSGLLLMAVSNWGYCIVSNSIYLTLFRMMTGVGFAVSTITLSICVANTLPKEKIGAGMGIYGMVQALGMAVAPAAALQIAGLSDYKAAFLVSGGCAFAAVVIVLFCVRVKEVPKADRHTEKKPLIIASALPITFIVLCETIPYSAITAFLATFSTVRGLKLDISIYFPIYALVLVVSRFFLKKYFDVVSFWKFFMICMPVISIALIVLNFAGGYLGMCIAAILMALGYGVMATVSQVELVRKADLSNQGAANCMYYLGLDSGMALGPMIAGLIYNYGYGEEMFFLIAVIPLISFLTLIFKRGGPIKAESKDINAA